MPNGLPMLPCDANVSMFANLALLGFFKFFNFFAGSVYDTFLHLHVPVSYHALNIILPIGVPAEVRTSFTS